MKFKHLKDRVIKHSLNEAIRTLLEKEKIGSKEETIEHKKIMKYKTLSICGSSKNFAGQIYDEFKNTKNSDLKRIVKIWKELHLNDMQPNCIFLLDILI